MPRTRSTTNEKRITAISQKTVTAIIIAMLDTDRAHVRRCVQSALSQTFEPAEINVYCSEQNSWIESELAGLDEVHLRRIPMCNAAVARNTGVEDAHSEYVAFIDADDYWYPKKLAAQVVEAERTSADIVVCDYWYHDIKGRRFAIGRCLLSHCSTWLIKRQAMLDHPFDPAFTRAQDVEWLIRTQHKLSHIRMRRALASVCIRTDSFTAAPNHKERLAQTRSAQLAQTPVAPLVLAISYIRYLQWFHSDWWQFWAPRLKITGLSVQNEIGNRREQ
jgi:glycosyltransferase involved in cell wall biosynthesis